MKNIIVSHKTALRIIRNYRIDPTNMRPLLDMEEYLKISSSTPLSKIDVLVGNKNQSRQSKKFQYHVATYNIKDNLLQKFTNNIYCVKPELLIIQLANVLSFEQLFLLISELCGSYSLDVANRDFETGLAPATSIEKVKKFKNTLLKDVDFFKGQTQLNKVLQYARDNSFSPMESKLLLKFSGPRCLGMYGIKGLDLNKPVKLSKKASLIAGQSTVIPDLSISKYKVAIEYDSAQFHEDVKQGQKDKRRRDALVKDN